MILVFDAAITTLAQSRHAQASFRAQRECRWAAGCSAERLARDGRKRPLSPTTPTPPGLGDIGHRARHLFEQTRKLDADRSHGMAQDISRSVLAGVDATTRVLDQDRLAIAGTPRQ
jgi:hypothetical protein